MQRIAFTPDETIDTTAAILQDTDIRLEINTVITGASSATTELDATELSSMLENDILSTRLGATVMMSLIHQAHDRIIGLRDDEPITVSGPELIPIVRDQRAADVSTITMPIQPIGVLKTTRAFLGWMIPISAGLGLLALVLGVLTRPDRRDLVRGLGEFGLALATSMLVFGYLLPVQFLTAIDNRTWTHAIPRLALRTLPVVVGTIAIFACAGIALILMSRSGGKRRQWSTPLSVARYRGGDNPGWG